MANFKLKENAQLPQTIKQPNSQVYVIMCGCYQNGISKDRYPIKIGISRNVHLRIATMQTGNPYPLICVALSKADHVKWAEQLEKYLHEKFAKYRIKLEWFALTKAQIQWIINVFCNTKKPQLIGLKAERER